MGWQGDVSSAYKPSPNGHVPVWALPPMQNGKDEHAPPSPHKMVHLAALPQPHAGIATTAATVKLKVSLFILSWSLFPYSMHGLVHDMKKETTYTDSTSLKWAKAYLQNNFYFFYFSRKCYLVTVKFSFAALYYWLLLTKTLSQLHWWWYHQLLDEEASQVSQGNNKKQFLLFRADPLVTIITAAAEQDSSAHLSDNHSYFINISARRQRMFPAFLPLF